MLSYTEFILERLDADVERNKWLDPDDDPKSKQTNDTVNFSGIEFDVEMDNDDISGLYLSDDTRQVHNWIDYLDDSAIDDITKLATGNNPKGKLPQRFTNKDDLDSVDVMFPDNKGIELSVYYTEPDSDGEFELGGSCVDSKYDIGQWFNEYAVELLHDLVAKKVS